MRWVEPTPRVRLGLLAGGILLAALAALPSVTPPVERASEVLLVVALVGAGSAAWAARPANPIGPLLCASGFLATLFLLTVPRHSALWPLTLGTGLFIAPFGQAIVTFPRGVPSGRAEWIMVAAIYVLVAVVVPVDRLTSDARSPVAGVAYVVVPLAALVLVLARWRRATAPARRVLAPMMLGGGMAIVAIGMAQAGFEFVSSKRPESLDQLFVVLQSAGVICVPLGLLAGLLRTRVTRSTLGELVVALGRVRSADDARAALARALGDDSLVVGYHADGGYVDAAGRPLALESVAPERAVTRIDGDAGALAVLVHDPALRDDPGLVEAVADAARLALENERLDAEVRAQIAQARASRARIVTVAEEERRRMEAELHSGVNQRLAALALSLRMLDSGLGDREDVRAMVQRAEEEVRAATRELRQLARGVHPEKLSREGLLAAVHDLARRSAVPVEVVAEGLRRYPDAVEGCGYFVCSEALQNVAKYARATRAKVRLVDVGHTLGLEITDDGIGGAHLGAGSGLLGLRDRIEALGGRLDVHSPPEEGTRLRATLPLNLPVAETAGVAG